MPRPLPTGHRRNMTLLAACEFFAFGLMLGGAAAVVWTLKLAS